MNSEEPSLLHHQNQIRARNAEGGLSTIIFCGRIHSGDLSQSLQVHRKIVEDEVNDEGVNVTGILIGQGNSLLHLLEGPSFSVLRILKHLTEHVNFFQPNPVQSGTVVYCLEDRPKRYFPEWYSCTIQETKSNSGEEVNNENCKDIVDELAKRLLNVGEGLHNETAEDLDLSRYANQLPGKSLLLSLSTSTCFFTIEEFVQFHCDSYHVELDSEQSWPLERLVQYN